jgi:hypothetical protein
MKSMRKTEIISSTQHRAILAAIGMAALVVGIYLYRFHSKLPHDLKLWADFGTYIGGTLGPAYAFLAFMVGLQTLQQVRSQNRREELLRTIQAYQTDFESIAAKPVSCDQPWVWGNDPGATRGVKEVTLGTLLFYDGIDWEQHLAELKNGLVFRVLSNGELIQDRDIWLRAKLAIDGMFRYLDLYKSAGGDSPLVDYYYGRYEFAKNRLSQ